MLSSRRLIATRSAARAPLEAQNTFRFGMKAVVFGMPDVLLPHHSDPMGCLSSSSSSRLGVRLAGERRISRAGGEISATYLALQFATSKRHASERNVELKARHHEIDITEA